MRREQKRQLPIVVLLVVVVVLIGLISPIHRTKIDIVHPQQDTVLSEQDLEVKYCSGTMQIGSTDYKEIKHLFPFGHTLGMSTIYKPDDIDCLLTFSKKGDILYRIHINDPLVTTARKIKVGDSFTQAVKEYGENYTTVSLANKPNDFDAVYGTGGYMIFQVKDNRIAKIIIEKTMQ